MARELPGLVGRYYEDFEIGDLLRTAGRTVTETDIVNFMGISGVYEELHMNVEYIKQHSVFGRRVSPGPLTFIIAEGLAVMTGMVHHTGMALLSVNNLVYRKPVFCNDTIHVEMTVIAKRETSKPDRGIVTFRHEVKNQAGEVTLEMEKVRMIRRRPVGEAAGSSSGTM